MNKNNFNIFDLHLSQLSTDGISDIKDFDMISFTDYARRIQQEIMAEGSKVHRFTNGDVYLGEWKDNLMNGKGIYSANNGDIYIGEWLDNLKHGNGIVKFSSGNIYAGNFKNGLRDGNGILICTSGVIYSGLWKCNISDSGYYFYDGKKSYLLKF